MGFPLQTESNLSGIENQTSEASNSNNRYYTLTVKACANEHKGNPKLLMNKFLSVIADMGATKFEYQIEHQGKPTEHFHALVTCPYIQNKMLISKQSKYTGFRIQFDVIRKEHEDDVIDQWRRYIKKELSDADRYYQIYGNMFE